MRKVLYLFGVLSDADVDWMAHAGQRRHVSAGEILIEQGKPAEYIVILLSGRLSISTSDLGVIATIGAGEVVGEMSLVDRAPPSATATAQTDCWALLLSKKLLQQKLADDIAFGGRFYRAIAVILADRLRGFERRMSGAENLLDEGVVFGDELDVSVLENLSMAGMRFEKMLTDLLPVQR